MLTAVKKNFSLIRHYIKLNLSSLMEYRISFLIQSIGMIINNGAFIFIWWVFFNHVTVIGGYNMADVMTVWALSSSMFGLTFILFGNALEVSRLIITGELDTYLLQPSDVIVNMLCSKSSVSAWGDLLYGYIVLIIFKGFSLPLITLFTVSVVIGALIMTSLLLVVNCLSFYIGNAGSIATLVLQFFMSFSLYPEGIYYGFVKYILYSIIPVGLAVHLPLQMIKDMSLQWLPFIIIATLLWVLIAYKVFYSGLKRYESGNLIINKM